MRYARDRRKLTTPTPHNPQFPKAISNNNFTRRLRALATPFPATPIKS